MSNNVKYFQLMQQVSDANPFKKSLIPRLFDLADDFSRDVQVLAANRNWSEEGRRAETQKALRRAIRDLRDSQAPIAQYRAETERMRCQITRPPYDRADVVGAMNRKELRDLARTMNFGQRQMRMIGEHRDQNFIDALLEHEAWVSGFDVFNPNERELYEAARQSRLRDLHAELTDQVEAREAIEAEVGMVVNVCRNDLAFDSGLQRDEFEVFAKPVETRQGAAWKLVSKRIDGSEDVQICEIQPDGSPRYRAVAPDSDEARDAKEYRNLEEYLAARAA